VSRCFLGGAQALEERTPRLLRIASTPPSVSSALMFLPDRMMKPSKIG